MLLTRTLRRLALPRTTHRGDTDLSQEFMILRESMALPTGVEYLEKLNHFNAEMPDA
jgi:hypothetical protein